MGLKVSKSGQSIPSSERWCGPTAPIWPLTHSTRRPLAPPNPGYRRQHPNVSILTRSVAVRAVRPVGEYVAAPRASGSSTALLTSGRLVRTPSGPGWRQVAALGRAAAIRGAG